MESDLIIPLGNEFVLKTYTDYNNKANYKSIDAFFFKNENFDINKKNFSQAKNKFLWFGSVGAIHKGLDILLDIFSNRDDIELHICGLNKNEKKFSEYYDSALNHRSNIINHGFVNIDSQEFLDIINICAFVVHLSLSEGGAPSVLTCMGNGGLIPIISRSTGIDIVGDNNLLIEKINRDEVEDKINKALKINEEELKRMSKFIQHESSQKYTLQNYKDNLKSIIMNFIKDNQL